MKQDRFHPLTKRAMILKPITYILILIASVIFWSGLSISSIKSEAPARTEGSIGKTTQGLDSLEAANTYRVIRKQDQTRKVPSLNHRFKITNSKVVKKIFSPDERLHKRSFFRNILKL